MRLGFEARRCVGGRTPAFLGQNTDPDVANVSLGAARNTLHKTFRDLPKLARGLEK
jgi:hypothetical protein